MKSFKEIMLEGSGKKVLDFFGTDDVGKFWVVTDGGPDSTLADILFEADIWDMILQVRGGLDISQVQLVTKSKSKAKKLAEKILATGVKQ